MSSTLYAESPKDQSFRLLKVMPGEWGDDLVTTLYMADHRHRFTALSYTWGTSRRSQKITVNDEIQYITFNLDRALRTLRSETESLILWIDSLCIDQSNVEEKTQQVALMHDLFLWAEDVHAYLGDSLDRSHPQYNNHFKRLLGSPQASLNGNATDDQFIEKWLFKYWPNASASALRSSQLNCCAFSLVAALAQPSWVDRIKSEDILSCGPKDQADKKLRLLFEHLRLFATSPWWERIWIVQEAGVARGLRFTYGRITICFGALKTARRNLETLWISSPSWEEYGKVSSLLAAKITTLNGLRDLLLHRSGQIIEGTEFQTPPEQLDYIMQSMGSPLLWLLRMFRNRRSSEPRDKVIALLQLRQDLGSFLNDKIDPDYGSAVQHLFAQVTFTILKTTGIFWITTGDLHSKSRHDVPSWVPDWSNDAAAYNPHHMSWKLPLLFNASKASYYRGDVSKNTPREHCRKLLQNTRYALQLEKPWRLCLAWVQKSSWSGWNRVSHLVQVDDGHGFTTSTLSAIEQATQQKHGNMLAGFTPRVALRTTAEFIDTIAETYPTLDPGDDRLPDKIISMVREFADIHSQAPRFDPKRPLLEEIGRMMCSGVFRSTRGASSAWYRIRPQSREAYLVSCVALWFLGKGFIASSSKLPESSPAGLATGLQLKNLFELVFHDESSCTRTESAHLVWWPFWRTFSIETASDTTQWENPEGESDCPIHLFNIPPLDNPPSPDEMFQAKAVVKEAMANMAPLYRPILTSKGFFGLAPLDAKRHDDHIFIIPGGPMPVVIRCSMGEKPKESMRMIMQSRKVTDNIAMTMVGTCYLDGFMDATERSEFMVPQVLCLI